jgi:hypothetical protein
MGNTIKYRKNANYRAIMADGITTEPVTYLGKNRQGMHRFLFGGGHEWTGYNANVVEE